LITLPCGKDDRVCDCPAEGEPDYFFVYTCLFTRFSISLPFSTFICSVLRYLHIDPTQLMPNGWAFPQSFELLCQYLGFPPSVLVFLYFFEACRSQAMNGVTWMSFHGVRGRSLILTYSSSFKNFRNDFMKITFDN
jgi:hypothetical protein